MGHFSESVLRKTLTLDNCVYSKFLDSFDVSSLEIVKIEDLGLVRQSLFSTVKNIGRHLFFLAYLRAMVRSGCDPEMIILVLTKPDLSSPPSKI